MQDPYSTMMSSQPRTDPYKTFQLPRQNSSSTNQASSGSSSNLSMSYLHGLQYNSIGHSDLYNAMTMSSSMGQEYSPLPAHMGSQNTMNSNGVSRINPTTHTLTHSATSPNSSSPQNTALSMSDVASPGPSTSRLSMSPEGQSQGGNSHMSNQSQSPVDIKNESSDSSSIKSGNEDDSGVPPKKRAHLIPDEQRDDAYWEKRKKNNESAKRSREARRMKEEQIALRVVYLEQENLQLRTEVSLLKSEIEKLRCMLYNS